MTNDQKKPATHPDMEQSQRSMDATESSEPHPTPIEPTITPRAEGDTAGTPRLETSLSEAAPSGRRQAFRDLRRQMTNEELTSPGVVKLLLDELAEAEGERDDLRGYVERYHGADKRAAVLEEKLKTARAFEIFFGVGIGIGGTIIGLAPVLWDPPFKGLIALAIGVLLVAGGIVARLVKQ